jgi:hypothetical protein
LNVKLHGSPALIFVGRGSPLYSQTICFDDEF